MQNILIHSVNPLIKQKEKKNTNNPIKKTKKKKNTFIR